jgi:hypothetical protein
VRPTRDRTGHWALQQKLSEVCAARERNRHLMVAEHYRAVADSTERSMKAAWAERFPRMVSAYNAQPAPSVRGSARMNGPAEGDEAAQVMGPKFHGRRSIWRFSNFDSFVAI